MSVFLTSVHNFRMRTKIMAGSKVYVLPPDGQLVFPGSRKHEAIEGAGDLSQSQQLKLLQFIRMIGSGEVDAAETLTWTDQQRREFVEALPECRS